MKYQPQLAMGIDMLSTKTGTPVADLVEKFICDPERVFQQKIDGHRLMIVGEDGIYTGHNRRGDAVGPVLEGVVHKAAPHLPQKGHWVFDGEWAQDQLNLFDMPEALTTIIPSVPYFQRMYALEAIYEELGLAESGFITVVKTYETSVEKRDLLSWTVANDAEGVVAKLRQSPYRPGKRWEDWVKVKHTDTCDVIVGTIGVDGKSSCSIDMIDENGKRQDVGAVKLSAKQLAAIRPDQVIEVRYLYMTDKRRLYQAHFKAFREDKNPEECTMDQCKMWNKQVRA